nr:cysteine-rich repeat secretory protein 3-like [Tanacetum cinerariifolium]
MDKLCGKTVAARIQLLGCYMLYEVSGFAQISGMEMLYKTCGKTTSSNGYQQTRDSAFSSLENAIGREQKGSPRDASRVSYNPENAIHGPRVVHVVDIRVINGSVTFVGCNTTS